MYIYIGTCTLHASYCSVCVYIYIYIYICIALGWKPGFAASPGVQNTRRAPDGRSARAPYYYDYH